MKTIHQMLEEKKERVSETECVFFIVADASHGCDVRG